MANKKIKGITIEIGADTLGLDKALKGVEQSSKKASDELREVNKTIKTAGDSAVLWQQKQKLLTDALEGSREKLKLLENAQEQVKKQLDSGAINGEQYRAFEREVEYARKEVSKYETGLEEANDKVRELGDESGDTAKDVQNLGDRAEDHPIVRMVQFNYSEFEGAMERLAADGMAYWQTVNTPKVTYEAQIASLRRDPRYKDFVGLQNYSYGDSGMIYCPELDISTTQRITEVEKDELTGDITRMLLGNLRESLSRPTYMGSTISSGRSIEDKQNRANQNVIMSQSISGMEQFAISALELRTIDQLEGQ